MKTKHIGFCIVGIFGVTAVCGLVWALFVFVGWSVLIFGSIATLILMLGIYLSVRD